MDGDDAGCRHRGIIAKAADLPYVGQARDWVKIKPRDTIDVVLGAMIGHLERPEPGRAADGR